MNNKELYRIGDIVTTSALLSKGSPYAEIGGMEIRDGVTYYMLYPIDVKSGHTIGMGLWFSEEEAAYSRVASIPDTICFKDAKLKAEEKEFERLQIADRSARLETEKSYYEKLRDDFVVKTMSEYRLRYPHKLTGEEILESVVRTANTIIKRLKQEQK
jgi:hypothetical protein